MARIETTPKAILEAVKRRLVASGAFTSDNVEISQHDADWESTPGEAWATIWLEGGVFDPTQIDGGMATITAQVSIGVHCRLLLDEAGRDDRVLLERSSGLLVLVNKIVQAFYLHDLMNETGGFILREQMRPLSIGQPSRDPGEWASIINHFEVMFDWAIDNPEGS